jgi:heme-degrading monooxygenase HmoA
MARHVDGIHTLPYVGTVHIGRSTVHVTWTALELAVPSQRCPWEPDGASFSQTGHGAGGAVEMPSFDGASWSVLATWEDAEQARAAAPVGVDGVRSAWHVVLEPVSFRGDAVLSAGARPFAQLPPRGKVAGAAAVITLAGLGPDPARTSEFLERFPQLGHEVRSAPGHRAALVQAPADGAVLTFSAWQTLRDAVTWAYHRPDHSQVVRRQEEHSLLATSGFLRCAVVASAGALGGTDPLAGLTGTPVPVQEQR